MEDRITTPPNDSASPQSISAPPLPGYTFPTANAPADLGIEDPIAHEHGTRQARSARPRHDSHVTNSDASFTCPILPGLIADSPVVSPHVDTPNSFDILHQPPTARSTDIPDGLNQLTPTLSHGSVHTIPSPWTSTLVRIYAEGCTWPLQRREEAVLMRHFVENLSICMDICDPDRHFALVVPHRATTCPTLLNAIFACSARHLSRTNEFDPYVSEKYHQECLKHLIPMLNDDAAVMDENLLAATIILRFFEEVKSM